ncbi:hypothetical protein F0562_023255 [Nyssa sinensis]|uniref:Myb/SANT-like DNA-binding domain-containing protein n=1 Tax=Nyssa sinensis TaxID=561372 RepID=A0A5J5BG31_9ASTE|nr:hypothetical protein F0562_023255 [Nyssa sinensis]
MEESFFDLVDFVKKPAVVETFVDILLCAVPIWVAVMIGLARATIDKNQHHRQWHHHHQRNNNSEFIITTVASRCPNASPSKTSAQCRHKMEKLRQRYHTEKQRFLSCPGRFFFSWVFFESMDSMENGTSAAVGSNQNTESGVDFGSGVQVKSVIDQNSVTLGFKLKNYEKIDGDSIPILDFDHDGVDPGGRLRVKDRGDRYSVPLGFRANNCSKIDGNKMLAGIFIEFRVF